MATHAPRDTPIRRLNETGIDRPRENVRDGLIADRFAACLRKFCTGFEKPVHFRLNLKASAGEAFQSLFDDF
jgi:hypothetical protein